MKKQGKEGRGGLVRGAKRPVFFHAFFAFSSKDSKGSAEGEVLVFLGVPCFSYQKSRERRVRVGGKRVGSRKCARGQKWYLGAQGGSAKVSVRNNMRLAEAVCATFAWRKHAFLSL